jgi:hypothetical protein
MTYEILLNPNKFFQFPIYKIKVLPETFNLLIITYFQQFYHSFFISDFEMQ